MVKRTSHKTAIKKLRPFVKGTIAGIITAVFFAVLGAVMFNIADAPDGADVTFGYITLGAAAGLCGMFWGGGRGKNGFAWGTLGGVAMFALCFIITVISGGFSGAAVVSKLLVSALCGCIGGIIGVNIAAEH